MLHVSNRLWIEARWFLGNFALLLVLAFGVLLFGAAVEQARSPDGLAGPGYGEPVPTRILLWSYGSMAFAVIWFAPLPVLIGLTAYRVVVGVVGHPRAGALIMAAGAASSVLLIPGANLSWVAIATPVALLYGAMARLPGHGLDDLPEWIHGAVVGLALSFFWVVGPLIAIAIATVDYRQGRRALAGWVLASAAALPAGLLIADLFRDDVPGLNYLVAIGFGAVAAIGVGLIARTGVERRPAKP
jgi:hypothetical protein